jgi:hypothetical protein
MLRSGVQSTLGAKRFFCSSRAASNVILRFLLFEVRLSFSPRAEGQGLKSVSDLKHKEQAVYTLFAG